MPISGSANPIAPPAPGDPKDDGLPKGMLALGFMKPSENFASPFMHSSKKPLADGVAGAASSVNVSGIRPNSPPRANALYARAMARAVPTAPPDGTAKLRA